MERRLTDVHEREFMHVHFKLSIKQALDIATEKIAVQEIQFTESLKQSDEKFEIQNLLFS